LTRRPPCRKLIEVKQAIVVAPGDGNKKLENFLKGRFPIGYVRKLFRKNGLRVNGKHLRPDDVIGPGDRIELFIPFEKSARHRASPISANQELPVLYEDASLLVLNKPAGLAVHEGKRVLKRHSVLGLLQNRYREQGIELALVHRLDRETSGLLVLAKNKGAQLELEAIFAEEKQAEKEYISLLAGILQNDNGTIDFPLPGREGKPVHALTRFRAVERFYDTTLVKAVIETGRMHQIRLHFAELGYPVVMDDQHGDFKFNKQFRKSYGLKRQFLHAARLSLTYGGQKHVFTAPLPDDLQAVLERVRAPERGGKR
jgi:23S rRNA pseudouridine955/2504/2580 synthase